MLRRMMQANLKNDVEPLVEVKGLLADLRATWAQAIEISQEEKRQATGVPAAAPKATTGTAPMERGDHAPGQRRGGHGRLQTPGHGDVRWAPHCLTGPSTSTGNWRG